MKVTTKGRVNIPQKIRDQMNIHPGKDVDLTIDGDAVKLVPTKKMVTTGKDLVNHMAEKGTVRMTTDEIMALTRGES